ncbi:40-residue YVTN family beta-propeller repeat-containing protein [Nocardioides exalbidus]|uniref:40-residue YVTN family beta-propeller repeat-containing protein n=1 Tax=Nocardioides exalbidus TaxID=402596 RepID=A0A1H4JLV9_9ACTN|nr:YncE family protein [Nocardioides exalbidus]SEB47137.1 40-residue YVTN family beta-propeller repeat-containing protein [Nocardioides exalbidus]
MTGALLASVLTIAWSSPAHAATTYQVVDTIDLGRAAGDGMAIDPVGRSAYVVHPAQNVVSVVDLDTHEVTAVVPVGAQPFRVAVDPELRRAYVSNSASNSLSVIDTTTHTLVRTIPGFSNPRGVAVDPTTHLVYVANFTGGENLAVVDPTVTPATINVTGYLGSRPWAVDVDPTTHRAYASTLFGGRLGTVAGSTIIDDLLAFDGPTTVSVDPVADRAYVAHRNTMSIVDISAVDAAVVGNLPAGVQPSDVAIDQASGTLYVSNSTPGTVSVVDRATSTLVATVPVGPAQSAIEIDPVTRQVYSLSGTGVLTVIAALSSQAITFTSAVPSDAAVGGTHTVTATGGGSGKPVTFSTTSTACSVSSTGTVAFEHAGSCVVSADQAGDGSHTAAPTATQTITVARGPQAITFTSVPPAGAAIGDSYPVSATGGASGQPVAYSVRSPEVCSISGAVVSLESTGTCVIAADQAGSADYTAAPTATQEVAVGLVATSTVVSLGTPSVVSGQAVTATATTSGTSAGSVQFTLDGKPVGAPVTLRAGSEIRSPDLTIGGLPVGAHAVGAVLTPDDPETYTGSTATPVTLTVSPAATTTTVVVGGDALSATVAPVAPGAGTPTGVVRFLVGGTEVGRATLSAGRATLAHAVAAGAERRVSAVYDGDSSFSGSSASTARRDPVITATTSSRERARNGWYRTPVTVTFECAATSAPLTGACPQPVKLSADGAGRTVTRTIVAADGGAATATVSVDIDRAGPKVRIPGVRAGATYFASGPDARCRATDRLSGVDRCTVRRTVRGAKIVYVATATDEAGNRTRKRVVARSTPVTIVGARTVSGEHVVRLGRTYTVLVSARTRPTYVFAATTPKRPVGGNVPFHRAGPNRWALGVTFTESMGNRPRWNIGVRIGQDLVVKTVRVLR